MHGQIAHDGPRNEIVQRRSENQGLVRLLGPECAMEQALDLFHDAHQNLAVGLPVGGLPLQVGPILLEGGAEVARLHAIRAGAHQGLERHPQIRAGLRPVLRAAHMDQDAVAQAGPLVQARGIEGQVGGCLARGCHPRPRLLILEQRQRTPRVALLPFPRVEAHSVQRFHIVIGLGHNEDGEGGDGHRSRYEQVGPLFHSMSLVCSLSTPPTHDLLYWFSGRQSCYHPA